MVSSGVDSNKKVYPILVDSSGRLYVNLNEPNPVEYDDTTAAHPKGIGMFGKWHTNAVWREIPVSLYTDHLDNRGRYVIPVGTMTSERVEGTKITDGTNHARFETDDDDIARDNVHLTVINLNYVWDAVGGKWVKMTQP